MKLYHEDCIKVLQSMPNESIGCEIDDGYFEIAERRLI